MIVFWDLDGPILDVSERYWRAHRDTLVTLGCSFLDKDAYWAMKRGKKPEGRILDACGASAVFTEYETNRVSRIESVDYLAHDVLQEGARAVLERVGATHQQILVTLRRDPGALHWQLEQLDLLRRFSAILSAAPLAEPRWKVKVDLIREHLRGREPETPTHLLITDTETDVRSGKEMGFLTVAVANGIRDRSILTEAQPDRVLDRTLDLLDLDLGSLRH